MGTRTGDGPVTGRENGYGDPFDDNGPGPVNAGPGLAAAGARRPRPPHCYIMGLPGTGRPRSIPGKGLTRVRSLTASTSMVRMALRLRDRRPSAS